MKITNFQYNNFCGTESFTDSPEKVNTLIAGNGKGKTTYIKALRYALTGDIRGEDFIKSDSSSVFTSVTVNGNTITREKKRGANTKVKINGKTTTQKSINQLFESEGVIPEAIKLISSSEVLGTMTSEELSEFFLENGIIPVSIDVEKLIYMLDTRSPLSSEIKDEIRKYFAGMKTIDLESMKSAYDDFYLLRKDAKVKFSEASAKASVIDTIVVPEMTLEEVDKKLTLISSDKTVAEQKAYENAVAQLNRINEQIKEIDAALSKSTASRPIEKELKELKEKREILNKSYDHFKKTLAVTENNIHVSTEILKNISTSKCPIHADIVCTSDKSAVKSKLEEALKASEEHKESTLLNLKICANDINEIDACIEKHLQNEKAYNIKLELIRRKNLLEDSKPTLPPKPVMIEDASKLAALKATLTEMRKRIIIYNEGLNNKKIAEEYKQKYDLYNTLVDIFSPKSGIREMILGIAVEPLIDECNKTAKSLKLDFEIRAELDNGFSISAKTTGASEFHSFDSLSNGEKMIVEILIMDMLNQLTGFNILVLDNLDCLDKNTFENVFKLITTKEMTDRYDHIYVSAVDHDNISETVKKYSVHKIM